MADFTFKVKQLPRVIQTELSSLGYRRKDVTASALPRVMISNFAYNHGDFTSIVNLTSGHVDRRKQSTFLSPHQMVETELPLTDDTVVIKGTLSDISPVRAYIYCNQAVLEQWKDAAASQVVQSHAVKAGSHGRYQREASAELVRIDDALNQGKSLPSAVFYGTTLTGLEKRILEIGGRKKVLDMLASYGARMLDFGFAGWPAPFPSGATEDDRYAEAKRMIAAAMDNLVKYGLVKRSKSGAVTVTTEGKNVAKGG